MQVVGKKGALEEGGGGLGGKIIENHVMDGQKDNDVISTAYRCLFVRPILIVSGAFGQTRRKGGGIGGRRGGGRGLGFFYEQEGSVEREGGGAGGGTFQYVRGNYESSKGTNLTIEAVRHPFISSGL